MNDATAPLAAAAEKRRLLAEILRRRAREVRTHPLSFAQQRLWFLDRMDPGGSAYAVALPFHLEGTLRADVLERALGEVVRRHGSLRTTFTTLGAEPVQAVAPPAAFPLPLADLASLPETEPEREALRLAAEEASRPFDLAAGPLFRARLLRLAPDRHVLVLVVHHIVTDGWSLGILLRETSALYSAFLAGAPSPLPALTLQYTDFAAWQRGEGSREAEGDREFWREALRGAPPLLELPTDRPRPPVPSHRGASLPLSLDAAAAARLREIGQAEGATLFMTLLAAFQLLLSRYSGQDDVVVGTPVAGRTRAELEGLIGLFVNTVAVRTDLSGDPTFRALLRRVRETLLGAYSHQDLPFDRLVDELQPGRSLSHSPVFQVMFAVQGGGAGEAGLALAGVKAALLETGTRTARFDLEVEMREEPGGLRGTLEYATDLFDRATAGRMAAHFEALLRGAVLAPDTRVSEVPLLDAAERRRLLEEWNDTVRAYPAGLALHEIFTLQAERTPSAVAVDAGSESLTYAELDRRSGQLAAWLRRRGVRAEERVGLCLEPSPLMVTAVLGVLRAGAAYVPLDPAHPRDRLALVLADAAVPLLLTQGHLAPGLPDRGAETVALDAEWGRIAREPPDATEARVAPEQLAYVIYTSGSTGQPKGVCVEHRSAANALLAAVDVFGFGPGDRVPALASYAFDIWLFEVLAPLLGGASVRLLPRERVVNMEALAQELESATVLHAVPSLMRQVVHHVKSYRGGALPGLRLACVGGDAVPPDLLDEMRGVFPAARVRVLYGPTESAIVCASQPVSARAEREMIGSPLPNARLYVCDRAGGPAPLGVPGELLVGGAGVTRGYLGRPDLTAERFVPAPYGGAPGARLYRTGDRARWLADGTLEFLGRTDHQVKVRGFRVEPGEVEAALERHPAVREAVVVARGDAPGDRRLVAYLVAAGGERAPSAAELREHLRGSLPEYMVPSAFVTLEALPLTPTGKLDRRALPAPERGGQGTGYVAPRTPDEELLARVWAEVLRIPRVGVDDNFFELGGDSILSIQVVARARQAGVVVTPRQIFERQTVAGLARAAAQGSGAELPQGRDPEAPAPAAAEPGAAEAREAGAGTSAGLSADELELLAMLLEEAGVESSTPETIRPRRPGQRVPLTFAQKRLWFLEQLEPENRIYNDVDSLRLTGELDAAALRGAFEEIVRRHEALRTVFVEEDGEPWAVAREELSVPLEFRDLAHLPEPERMAEVRRVADEATHAPFDLARGPLIRPLLLRLGERDHALLIPVHHIVTDGWSQGILFREVFTLYDAFRRGKPSPLPPPALQYGDFAVWQQEYLAGGAMERQVAYWKERLRGAPTLLELPTDRPRPAEQTYRGAAHEFMVSREMAAQLQTLAQERGATLYMVILAAFSGLLARYTGEEDIVVGSPIANRTRPELEPLVGLFANTLAVRTDTSGDPTFRELLERVRDGVFEDYAHQDLPFERLVEELRVERSLSHNPVYQVLLTLQNTPRSGVSLGGLEMHPLESTHDTAKLDLSLTAIQLGEGLYAGWEYSTELFDRASIVRLTDRFVTLLRAVAENADRRISELPLVTPEERVRVLYGWNRPALDEPAGAPVHERFDAQAERTPEAVALVSGERSMTYGELRRRSASLAGHLRARGVGPEVRVGVCLERSPESIVALLGVLKAGGAYVPLDAASPRDRLAYLVEDSGIALLLTQERLFAGLPGSAAAAVVFLDTEWERIEAEPGEVSGVAVDPRNAAYVIYTSGSTGKPKGVVVPHAALSGYTSVACQAYGIGPYDRVLQFASVAFDASAEEIYPTLVSGARLVLRSEEMLDSASAFLGACRAWGITVVDLPTAYWHELAAELCEGAPGEGPALPETLRLTIIGGERALPEHLRAWRERFGDRVRLVNTYGPTETTVVATLCDLAAAPDEAAAASPRHVPIGRPIPGAWVYVLDSRGEPAGIGMPGELYVGGTGVARGYLDRPALTAERFLPEPFGAEPGARVYRTGDRVRWLADGTLEFMGRVDQQVKVRGFRVELGEIEAALNRSPGVEEAVVVARADARGDTRLAAYVVLAKGAAVSAVELRSALRSELPGYMIPGAFVPMEALPLTRNGKVDRRSLPAPDAHLCDREPRSALPRNDVERTITEAWREVLGVDEVGLDDNFFDLGGHSLLLARLRSRLAGRFAREVSVVVLFRYPTVRSLAEYVTQGGPEAPTPEWSAVEVQSRREALRRRRELRRSPEG